MAQGYLVSLGDGKLDPGDNIPGSGATFNIDRDLGPGEWMFSGEDSNGTTYVDEVEPGRYVLADNGNVYFIPDFGMLASVSSASVVSHESDGVVTGTDGNDGIGVGSGDVDGDGVDDGDGAGPSGNSDSIDAGAGNDTVSSGAGDDTVDGGSGNDIINTGAGNDVVYGRSGDDNIIAGDGDDLIYGGAGADTIDAGSGNDTIYGDSDPAEPVSISSGNYTDTSSGFTLTAQNVQGGALTTASTSNVSSSGGRLGANGAVSDTDSGDDAQLAYDKASGLSENLTATFDAPVTEASFSFDSLFSADFAESGHWAVYDNGVLVAEGDFFEAAPGTGSGVVNVSGVGEFDTLVLTANLQSDGTDGSDYSVTDISFTPAAPPSGNAGTDSLSGGTGNDVIYGEGGADTVDGGADNDLIYGGQGADSLHGGAGDDTIYASQGDTVTGGDGDDRFFLEDLNEAGAADIFIDGGEEGASDQDVLDLTGVSYSNLTITSTDATTGEMSGNLTLDDGSVVYFNNIEEVVCFAMGARITTPSGPVRVEDLRAGDLVLTRDCGPLPVLSVARTSVRTTPDTRAVRFATGAWGNTRPVTVSPNHRVICDGPSTELHFGAAEVLVAARKLTGLPGVSFGPVHEAITWFHILMPAHALLFSDGLISESFYPSARSLDLLTTQAKARFVAALDDAGCSLADYGPTVRPTAKAYEAACMVA